MSDDGLLARVEALEAMAIENDAEPRILELEKKVAQLEQHGPVLKTHKERLDGHDEQFAAMRREFALWRNAIANDIQSLLTQSGGLREDFNRFAAIVTGMHGSLERRDTALTSVNETMKGLAALIAAKVSP